MEMKKIKAIRCIDQTGMPSATLTTLGISFNGIDMIFGSYYFGEYMSKETEILYKQHEAIIDYIIALNENKDGEKP